MNIDDVSHDEMEGIGAMLASLSREAAQEVGLDPEKAAGWILEHHPEFRRDRPDDREVLRSLLVRLFRSVWFADTCSVN